MGRKKIAWTNQAKAQLRAIDQPVALRILHGLARLLATGDTLEITAVKNRREAYR
jgi:hypothetical protein